MIHENIDFVQKNAGNLTSDAGFYAIDKFNEKIGLYKSIEGIKFNDSRKFPIHSNTKILCNLIMLKQTGYLKPAILKYLNFDPFLNLKGFIVSPSTVTRFYDRCSIRTNQDIKNINYNLAYQYTNQNYSEITLDPDSTGTNCYGKQEASAYISHYKKVGYHPSLISCAESGLILHENLRQGNIYTSKDILIQLEEVISQLKSTIAINLRADSGYHSKKIFEWLLSKDIKFAIKGKSYATFTSKILDELDELNIDSHFATKSDPYYGFLSNCEEDYDVHYMAYYHVDKENGQYKMLPEIQIIFSNMNKSSLEIFEFYRKRASSENIIKEIKDDFGGNTLSHKKFIHNELDFTISNLCFNISRLLQLHYISTTKHMKQSTLLLELIKVAGKITKHSGKICLNLATCYPFFEKYKILFYE